MESWQIFSYALHELPRGFIRKLYTRSYPLVQAWAAGPTNEIRHRNPIDRITILLSELAKAGRDDIARAGIDIMAEPLGGHFSFHEEAESDKGSVDGEAADVAMALGHLIESVRYAMTDGEVNAREMAHIRDQVRCIKDEINQLFSVVEEAADGGGVK